MWHVAASVPTYQSAQPLLQSPVTGWQRTPSLQWHSYTQSGPNLFNGHSKTE